MIEFVNVSIDQGAFSLTGINFTIEQGEYAVLMGRSGCGKTTLLELLCGLRKPKRGKILIDGCDVTAFKPAERGIGYVPQDGALFPTMRVDEQLGFALNLRGVEQVKIQSRVEALAKRLDIENLLTRYPQKLSGGEVQRVALGRALAIHPRVLCLDEPLSALDEVLHEEQSALLLSLAETEDVTVLHVTHSLSEAKKLADIILRLEAGCIAVDQNLRAHHDKQK